MSATTTTFPGGMTFPAPPRPKGPEPLRLPKEGDEPSVEGADPEAPGPKILELLRRHGLRDLWSGPDADERVRRVVVSGVCTSPLLPSFAGRASSEGKAYSSGLALLRKAFDKAALSCFVNEDELEDWRSALPDARGLRRRYPQEVDDLLVEAATGVQQDPASAGVLIVPAEDLPLIHGLVAEGRPPVEREIVVATREDAVVLRGRVGQTFGQLLGERAEGAVQIIAGNVFNGAGVTVDDLVELKTRSVVVLPLRTERPLLGFLRVGSRVEADRQGQLRFCVNCSRCECVCPAGLLPQFLHKLVQSDMIEEAEELGLMDCVECGLCSYVCPSKIELLGLFSQGKKDIGAHQ